MPTIRSRPEFPGGSMSHVKKLLAGVALVGLLLAGLPALADEHDPKVSGHPLRILAYAMHPVGVIVDTLVFRPAHWLVSYEPLKTLFGHEDG